MLTVRTSSSQLYGARCVKGLMLFIVNDSRRKYSEGLWFEYQLGPEFFSVELFLTLSAKLLLVEV